MRTECSREEPVSITICETSALDREVDRDLEPEIRFSLVLAGCSGGVGLPTSPRLQGTFNGAEFTIAGELGAYL